MWEEWPPFAGGGTRPCWPILIGSGATCWLGVAPLIFRATGQDGRSTLAAALLAWPPLADAACGLLGLYGRTTGYDGVELIGAVDGDLGFQRLQASASAARGTSSL